MHVKGEEQKIVILNVQKKLKYITFKYIHKKVCRYTCTYEYAIHLKKTGNFFTVFVICTFESF